MAAHDAAMELGLKTYTDPDTGYTVFTAGSHLKRGTCCGKICRHCPYNHVNVPGNKEGGAKGGRLTSGSSARVEEDDEKNTGMVWNGKPSR